VLPKLVALSIGGFVVAFLIMGTQLVLTRNRRPKRPARKAPLRAKR
jgi:hypothetical protein